MTAHVQHGVTPIFFAIGNLPLHLRSRPENMICAGIIPGFILLSLVRCGLLNLWCSCSCSCLSGPKEFDADQIANCCRPLADELNKLYHGIDLDIGEAATQKVHALFGVSACDLPGTKRYLGLPGALAAPLHEYTSFFTFQFLSANFLLLSLSHVCRLASSYLPSFSAFCSLSLSLSFSFFSSFINCFLFACKLRTPTWHSTVRKMPCSFSRHLQFRVSLHPQRWRAAP